jgi:hypothetical protein
MHVRAGSVSDGDSDIHALVVDVPLQEQHGERSAGEVSPPVLLDVLGLLGADDRGVADLDLVGLFLALGDARGTRPRGAISLSRKSNRLTAKGRKPLGSQRPW